MFDDRKFWVRELLSPAVSIDYNDTYIDLRVAFWIRAELLARAVLLSGSDFPRGVFYYVLLRR